MRTSTLPSRLSPVRQTLRWVVVMGRLVGWLWSLAMIMATTRTYPEVDDAVALIAATVGTVWAGVTLLGARGDRFLAQPWFVVVDGLVAFGIALAALAAQAPDFISGGYPMSWLFVVAYASSLRWTMLAALSVSIYSAVLHGVLDLGAIRTVGSVQYLVVGLIAGWAFDSLRERESLLLDAHERLRAEEEATTRFQERAALAAKLHDSVLQTLHAIRLQADDDAQVRYLARRQERELRRTIDEYSSPFAGSFRAGLLAARDEVEDLCRVEIEAVIRDDAEVGPALAAAIAAAREAMINAAKHSGTVQIHLYSEITEESARISVRDRGSGFPAQPTGSGHHGLQESLTARVVAVGGQVVIDTGVGAGTDVLISVPLR